MSEHRGCLPTRRHRRRRSSHRTETDRRQPDAHRAEHGNKPTLYNGVSRGGVLALLAAQRDPLAGYVIAEAPGVIHEGRVSWPWRQQINRQLRVTLAARKADNPPGVWVWGELDEHSFPATRRALHAAGGHGQALRILPGVGHEWPPGWRKVVSRGIARIRAALPTGNPAERR